MPIVKGNRFSANWLRPALYFAALASLLLPVLLLVANAHSAEPFRVLIKNAYLPDPEGEAEDVAVDILITDNQLDVVTQDSIAPETADISMDAQSGYLLGSLDPGEPPSFVILAEDPRGNLKILMNTKPYVRLAVQEGRIIKSSLPVITAQPAARKQKRSGWLSYEPPPMTVPLDYRDKTQWNRFESRYISGLLTGALLLDRTWWFDQDSASRSQVGDLEEFEVGELRGLRFGAVGTLNFDDPWFYTVFLASHTFDKGFDSTTDDEIT
jgi:phosphate-selective porin OprO/OprP